jgi:transposase
MGVRRRQTNRQASPEARARRRELVQVLYVDQRLGSTAIAKRLGVSHATVRDDLIVMGVHIRKTHQHASPAQRAARELEVERLYRGGMTIVEIADELGLTGPTVWNDLRRCQVPRRPIARRPKPSA